MEITGRLIKILPETRGESARGPWVRGGFVIETDGEYPRQVAFTCFGEDRVAMIQSVQLNSPVAVTFTPESREFNERWYTDLRCTRIQNYVPGQMPPVSNGYQWNGAPQQVAPAPQPTAQPAAAAHQQQAATPFASTPTNAMPNTEDDLPF
ncbi:MAG: DUF3127 domain-containing protein [Bacteroidales bacterium]|nr:DUF3127 domain-containing protein [Bacteroidales bacterium]